MRIQAAQDETLAPITKVVQNDLIVDSTLRVGDPRIETNNTRLATLLKNKFEIDPEQLALLLRNTNGILAGGALLWTIHPWCHYSKFDGDIDLFVEEIPELSRRVHTQNNVPEAERNRVGYNQVYSRVSSENPARVQMLERLRSFFEPLGYTELDTSTDGYDRDYDSFLYVNTINTFRRPFVYVPNAVQYNRKINVIFLSMNPVTYLTHFDIDLLRFGWNGREMIKTSDTERVYTKKDFLIRFFEPNRRLGHPGRSKSNLAERICKYVSRGFVTQPIPDPSVVEWAMISRDFLLIESLIKQGFPVNDRKILSELDKCANKIPCQRRFWKDFLCSKELQNYSQLDLVVSMFRSDHHLNIGRYVISELVLENKICHDIMKYITQLYIV